jgi:hypothetical protein
MVAVSIADASARVDRPAPTFPRLVVANGRCGQAAPCRDFPDPERLEPVACRRYAAAARARSRDDVTSRSGGEDAGDRPLRRLLTFFNTWVLFEETVIDRYGLWEYLPWYRVGKLCSWDIGAMSLFAFIVWRVFRPRMAVR